MAVGERHVRPLSEDALVDLLGLTEPAVLVEIDAGVDGLIDLDEALRIVGLGVGGLARRVARHVAERAQAGERVRVLGHARAGQARAERAQRGFERPRDDGRSVDEVGRFAGIGRQVVQLRDRQVDELVAAAQDPRERRPASVEHRRHRFEVRRPRRRARTPLGRGQERSPRQPRGRRHADGVEDRRQQVDVPHRHAGHFGRRRRAPAAELRDDERHSERRLVREQPVRRLAVIAERLAVIAGDDDEGGGRRAAQIVEERRKRRVDGGHLAVVRLVRVLAVEGRRRLVRRVGIEDVHPLEERRAWLALLVGEPRARERHDGRRRALGHDELGRLARLAEPVVVDVEAGVQPEARVQRKRADEGARRVAGLLEQRGDRRRARGEPVAAVLAHAVLVRVFARQDAGVRGQRERRLRVREGEAHAFRGEPVERGRARGAAVAAERVGAERVDRDEQDVLARNRPEIGLRGPPPQQHRQPRGDGHGAGGAGEDREPPRAGRPNVACRARGPARARRTCGALPRGRHLPASCCRTSSRAARRARRTPGWA